MPVGAGLPEMPEEIKLAPKKIVIDWKRIAFIVLGLALFSLFYFMSDLGDAVDPSGKHFPLPPQGRMAIGLFPMAAEWWIFEEMPIGATAIGHYLHGLSVDRLLMTSLEGRTYQVGPYK